MKEEAALAGPDASTPSEPTSDPMRSANLAGRRVLYISYNGMLDPLGQSQVLPYLRALSGRGVQFTLLSYERSAALAESGADTTRSLKEELRRSGIEWHWLHYHQRPSLPATSFDVANGVRLGRSLIRKNKIELLHARSHIPATIALALKKQFKTKMIFDVRGLMADEYVDAEHWRKGSVAYRLTKGMERHALAAADGVVTLTHRIWPIIKGWDGLSGREDVVHEVVPCCADLDLFSFSETDREWRRRELGIDSDLLLVYSGSIDGWYLTEQMADFFAFALKRRGDAHALWLTPTRHQRVRDLMRLRNVADSRFTVVAAKPHEVPSYLSASDAGIAFIKPCPSKLASSPTKYAEYLGCGLPLAINSGIGDSDTLISLENAGALVRDFTPVEFEQAAATIERFTSNQERTRKLTRAIAERLFDVAGTGVESYARLYASVLR